jgi:hypothetical protein
MRKKVLYRIIDNSTGEVVVEGDLQECADAVGYSKSWVKDCVYCNDGVLGSGKYTAENFCVDDDAIEKHKGCADIIKMWDDFVTPIREAYGIPRYREKSGVR